MADRKEEPLFRDSFSAFEESGDVSNDASDVLDDAWFCGTPASAQGSTPPSDSSLSTDETIAFDALDYAAVTAQAGEKPLFANGSSAFAEDGPSSSPSKSGWKVWRRKNQTAAPEPAGGAAAAAGFGAAVAGGAAADAYGASVRGDAGFSNAAAVGGGLNARNDIYRGAHAGAHAVAPTGAPPGVRSSAQAAAPAGAPADMRRGAPAGAPADAHREARAIAHPLPAYEPNGAFGGTVANAANVANAASESGGAREESGSKKQRRSPIRWFRDLSVPKKILAIVAMLLLLAILAGVIVCAVWLRDLPECDDADSFNTVRPTEVYASDRTTLLARFQLENREPLESLDDISTYAVEGTVATEDERFYKHSGVDLIGIGRAVMNNLSGGTLEGASTITQQLVRNTVLADEMSTISLQRKIREAYLALKMETMYDKDDILLLYMNTINYGSGAYGIEAAAKRYFSKSASELTLNEAATLVGIPQSPTYNNPIDNMDHAVERRNIVLDRMVSYGTITQAEADAVKAEPIVLNTSEPSNDGILLYPYFTSYVRSELLNNYDLDVEDVFQGGMTIYTTLDVTAQEQAQETCDEKMEGANEALDIALAAVDTSNGHIKAMVGGKDYYADQWNLATQAQRQAGSSFKTFTLVAALEDGISPSTQVDCCSTITLNDYNVKVSNYDKIDYGTRSIERAFHVSSNTGFTRLILAVGASKVAKVAYRMGIQSDLVEVPTLTLGTSGVSPLEMADAYACIANGGTHYDAVSIEQAIDRKGNVVIDNTDPEGEYAISPEVAQAARDVMRGVITSYEGTGTQAALANGQDAIGKTGTTDSYNDSWFVGCIPQMSVAIWIGDRSNTVSTNSAGGTCADVFSGFFDRYLEGKELTSFPTAGYPTYTRTFKNTALDTNTTSLEESPSPSPSSSSARSSSPKPSTVSPSPEDPTPTPTPTVSSRPGPS